MAILSVDFIVTGSGLQNVGSATEKARLSILSLVLGTQCCLETDDLRLSKSRRYIREMLYACLCASMYVGVGVLCPYYTPREYNSFCRNKSTSLLSHTTLLGTILKLLL